MQLSCANIVGQEIAISGDGDKMERNWATTTIKRLSLMKFISVLGVVTTIIYFHEFSNYGFNNPKILFCGHDKCGEGKDKVILLYTSFFGEKPWHFVLVHKNYTRSCGCNFTGCTLTYDRNKFKQSVAVVFHARDMPIMSVLEELHGQRPVDQKWIYFALENPRNEPDVRHLDKYFNWTLTYRLKSNFRMPYGHYSRLKHKENATFDYAKGHTKQVAWLVSHCGTLRDQLAKKLDTYGVTVDVGGQCRRQFNDHLSCLYRDEDCTEVVRKHKFYFAAENNLCEDYVTEKYWTALSLNLVPIVLGGSDYSNRHIAIPGSFIDALSFKTPKHLAEHLIELDKNNTKYNKYFEWKNTWKVDEPVTGCQHFMCDICQHLHREKKKENKLLSQQINAHKECDVKERKFKRWINLKY